MLRPVPAFLILGAVAAAAAAAWFFAPELRLRFGQVDFQQLKGEDRIRLSRWRRGSELRRAFAAAGVAYPPEEIFLRGLKREARLELWARDRRDVRFSMIRSYPILASSGRPGPKRREGDRQVPEGFYELNGFNLESSFHLSMRLNYPNASDARRSDPEKPGFDIFIHGGGCSVGCLPIGDDRIEELFLCAWDVRARGQRKIPVHLFPAAMEGAAWEDRARETAETDPALAAFWEELRPGYEAFEKRFLPPEIAVDAEGRYRVSGDSR